MASASLEQGTDFRQPFVEMDADSELVPSPMNRAWKNKHQTGLCDCHRKDDEAKPSSFPSTHKHKHMNNVPSTHKRLSGDGRLSLAELGAALRRAGARLGLSQVTALFRHFIRNGLLASVGSDAVVARR